MKKLGFPDAWQSASPFVAGLTLAGIGVSSKLDIVGFLLDGGRCLCCSFLAVRYPLTVRLFPSLRLLSIVFLRVGIAVNQAMAGNDQCSILGPTARWSYDSNKLLQSQASLSFATPVRRRELLVSMLCLLFFPRTVCSEC